MSRGPLPMPLYQRVYAVLYRRIQRGIYAPGSALSTEDELAAEFGVSKATIRQAVGAMVERGLVDRRQGRGTYLRDDLTIYQPHPLAGSLTDLIMGTPEMSYRESHVESDVPFPADVRAELGMSVTSGTTLVHHRDLNGERFAYTIIYLSPLVTELIPPEELEPVMRATLERERGMPITSARQSISAEIADVQVAENLSIEIGQPVLFSERVVHSNRQPVEFIQTWYRGDLFKWTADLALTLNETE